MLQFIAKDNDKYSIPELVQMAIEGGCKWVQLDMPDADDASIREVALELVPLCKESETILTIVDHLELAKELGIHGVLLANTQISPFDAREFCGPEAIIGIQVSGAMQVVPLKRIDVDYATFTPDMPIEKIKENVEAIRSADIELPLVAAGSYKIEQIPGLMAAGVSGLALSDAIALAEDPVEATKEILKMLGR